jgi:hypothetical protein
LDFNLLFFHKKKIFDFMAQIWLLHTFVFECKKGAGQKNQEETVMKRTTLFALALGIAAFLSGCGGGDESSQGTISMNITDAKPVLPVSNVESVSITFNEVSVHKAGGGWTTLQTAQQRYTVDLYQFTDGKKTQIVPPVRIDSGKYTQLRIGVVSGTIRIAGQDYPLEVPSANLKTDKNFDFDVEKDGAVDLTVDFDLSRSIVVTGSGTYQLKPVLHLNETSKAATIQGAISFGSSSQATVVVIWDKNGNGLYEAPNPSDPNSDEEYTRMVVGSADPSPFQIFWLVPNQGYFVQVMIGERASERIYVAPSNLQSGAGYPLNGGAPIAVP